MVATVDSGEWNSNSDSIETSSLAVAVASELTTYIDGAFTPDGTLVLVGNSNVWTEVSR
jgi:hypothetical protein